MAAIINDIDCPMMQGRIELGYCVELQMIADGAISATAEEEELTAEQYVLCKKCKKRHNLVE